MSCAETVLINCHFILPNMANITAVSSRIMIVFDSILSITMKNAEFHDQWTIEDWKTQNKVILCSDTIYIDKWRLRLRTRRLGAKSLFGLSIFATDPIPDGSIEFEFSCRLSVGEFSAKKPVQLRRDCPSDSIYPQLAWIESIDRLCPRNLVVSWNIKSIRIQSPSDVTPVPASLTQTLPPPKVEPIPVKPPETKPKAPLLTASTPGQTAKHSYVGLQNQGATCYMNSALQALFHLPAFRMLVYRMPTEATVDKENSIPLNLQVLFYEMQTGDKVCSTRKLTKSFGWNEGQAFVQHDIQEFLRVLANNIEEKLKNSGHEKDLANLFDGELEKTITGPRGYQSSMKEPFSDISLQVKGCYSIEKSLKQYMAPETIDEYNIEQPGIGKCKVTMQKQFTRLPPVLQVHLKRFEFDITHYETVKIDSRFEFSDTLNLQEFATSANRHTQFKLYGVLVHSGDARGGHYYVYLRPGCHGSWYRFNDSFVEKVQERDAIERNFGGYTSTRYTKIYSAYMLFYVREDQISTVFPECTEADIGEHIKAFAAQSSTYDEPELRNITILTEDMLRSQPQEIGLSRPTASLRVKVDDRMNTKKLYEFVAEQVKLEPNSFRLWHLNGSYRLNTVVVPDVVSEVHDYTPTLFFVQNKGMTEEVQLPEDSLVLFVKFYTKYAEFPMIYIRSVIVKSSSTVSQLVSELARDFGLDTFMDVYVEAAAPYRISKYNTWRSVEIKNGDAIYLQSSESLPADIVKQFVGKSPEKSLSASSVVNYRDVIKTAAPRDPREFMSDVSSASTIRIYNYEDIENHVMDVKVPNTVIKDLKAIDLLKEFLVKALELEFDPKKDQLLLFGTPRSGARQPDSEPLTWIFDPPLVLYYLYQKGVKVQGSNWAKTLTVLFSNDGFKITAKKCFFVESPTVGDVKALVASLADGQPLRVMTVTKGEIKKVYQRDSESVDVDQKIVCGVIPENQRSVDISKLVPVMMAVIDEIGYFSPFGIPFFMNISADDTVSDVLTQVKHGLSMSDEALRSLRVVVANTYDRFDNKKLLKKEARFGDCYPSRSYSRPVLILIFPSDRMTSVATELKLYN